MRIDFEYLDSLYEEEPQVKMIRKTKIVEDFNGESKKTKSRKEYNSIRMLKYET